MPVRHVERFVCGRRTPVPDSLVRTVLELARTDDASADIRQDVFATLVCTIEAYAGPVHYGAALNLRGPRAGTLWALWRDGGEPNAALEIPDCPARTRDAVCSEFEGHPGGHIWELADPPRIAAAFPLQRRPVQVAAPIGPISRTNQRDKDSVDGQYFPPRRP